jgi:hypothetical protein
MKRFGLSLFVTLLLVSVWSSNDYSEAAQRRSNAAIAQNFDAAFYAAENPDVVSVYGNSERKLLQHYMSHGRYEGRSASSDFNLMSYRSLHSDLYQAFSDDLDAYAAHYRDHGRAEGRVAISDNPPRFEPVERPLIYEMEGIAKGRTDIGKTYVEVDLTEQHLYLFVDGAVIMDTDIVTGDESRGWSTPSGIYQIYSKQTNRYLSGPGYKVWVSYWMPYKGGIGFHDASYRNEFGGNIYQTNGSHGCVNMPVNKAALLYRHAFVGMYVICH